MKLKVGDSRSTPISVNINGKQEKLLEGTYHAKTGKAFGWGSTENHKGTFKNGVPHGICKNYLDSNLIEILFSDYASSCIWTLV